MKLYSRKSDDIFRYCNIQVSRRANLKHLDLIRISKKTSSGIIKKRRKRTKKSKETKRGTLYAIFDFFLLETISFLGIVSYTNPPEIKILKEKEKEVGMFENKQIFRTKGKETKRKRRRNLLFLFI